MVSFPISWIVFSSIMLYRLAVDTGKFEIIKDSVGGLTNDRRLQALFIAFSFGAFIEGAAGFGAPVAVSGAMLAGLGFPPFYAAGICLMANTAPVAFGSIGIPVTTLAGVTGHAGDAAERDGGPAVRHDLGHHPDVHRARHGGMEEDARGAAGRRHLRRVVRRRPVLRVELHGAGADRHPELAHLHRRDDAGAEVLEAADYLPTRRRAGRRSPRTEHSAGQVFVAWLPYMLLVVFVLAWGEVAGQARDRPRSRPACCPRPPPRTATVSTACTCRVFTTSSSGSRPGDGDAGALCRCLRASTG